MQMSSERGGTIIMYEVLSKPTKTFLAQKMFDHKLLMELLLELLEHREFVPFCLAIFNSMAKNGTNLARRIFENIQGNLLNIMCFLFFLSIFDFF